MYIDTHAHVNFNVFKDDAEEVIKDSLANETWMILVGTNYKTSKAALHLANKYERGVYAAIGLHPLHVFATKVEGEDYSFNSRQEDFDFKLYEKLLAFEEVVAVGEVGLDYYHLNNVSNIKEVKKKQQEIFYQQLLLARKNKLPVIIHCRDAHDDTLKVINEFKKEQRDLLPKDGLWGVMHCFSGDEDLAWQYFNLGLMISFTGLITFSRQWDDLIRKMPLDKFLVETDCPYMTPEPFRGQRNIPTNVKLVAARIAEIKNLTKENS
ncbi:MAG: TatD family hydrolase [Candidatus Falkowbacteria bacterium]|nr:TatD family hydrolase [Candidatus Falkowbacteria bacterium]